MQACTPRIFLILYGTRREEENEFCQLNKFVFTEYLIDFKLIISAFVSQNTERISALDHIHKTFAAVDKKASLLKVFLIYTTFTVIFFCVKNPSNRPEQGFWSYIMNNSFPN